jgi:hypothetical protein
MAYAREDFFDRFCRQFILNYLWKNQRERTSLVRSNLTWSHGASMALRAVVAQEIAARTSNHRNAHGSSGHQPTVQQKTRQPHLAPAPFDVGEVRQPVLGEQPSSLLPQAIARVSSPRPIQTKLEVGAANDPLEREADQLASRIMHMADPASMSSSASGEVVQRKCQTCTDEEEKQTVQRKCQSCSDAEKKEKDEEAPEKLSRKEGGGAAALGGTAAPALVREVVRSPGRPLNPTTRAFFEPRFGYDFSRVRIHSDAQASAAAQAVNALAYTVGKDVVFGAAQFAPHTTKGRTLLAHELTHVIQQSQGSSVRRISGVPVQRRTAEAVVQREPEVKADPGATCDLDQHRKIEPAAYLANEWLSRTIPAIEGFLSGAKTIPAQTAAAALSKHFHSLDAAVVRYVRDRLETIQNDIFGRRNFRVNCPPASDPACGTRRGSEEYAAVVPEGNPNEINLCRPFFERKVEDRASTIIHEFGHTQLGLSAQQQIVDRGYQWDAYYAYLTTGQALTNAESYAMFAREVATGFSPAHGFISDSLRECPNEWIPIISDAITKARMWNHQAALHTPARHEFSRAYKTLDTELKSDFSFKCIPDGGGRCGDHNVAYWYAAGDLRICPSLIGLTSPDQRALSMLAALYGYKSLVDGDDRQGKAAIEARRLHLANIPSAADVLSGK